MIRRVNEPTGRATGLNALKSLRSKQRFSRKRFNQANATPFIVPPLHNLIAPLGIGPQANAVLDGTFVAPPGTDPCGVKLIYQLEKEPVVDQAPPILLILPLDEYLRGGKAVGSKPHQVCLACTLEQAHKYGLSSVPRFSIRTFGPLSLALSSTSRVRLCRRHISVINSQSQSKGDVAHTTQQGLDLWEGGIRATGGAIAP